MPTRNAWLTLMNIAMFGALVAMFVYGSDWNGPAAGGQSQVIDTADTARSEPDDPYEGLEPHEIGMLIFSENCVECHTENANGGSGGDIRDSDYRLVMRAARGSSIMPVFEFEKFEIEAIVAYLETL